MAQIIAAIVVIALYLGLLYVFFRYVALYLAALLAAIGVVFALVDRIAAFGSLGDGEEREVPPEPARRNYFFDRGWRELGITATRGWIAAWRHAESAGPLLAALFAGDAAAITWPIGLVAIASLIAAVLVGAVVHVAISLVHALVLALVATLLALFAIVLRMIDVFMRLVRRASYVCPHKDCHQRMSIPLYRCRSCAAEHFALLPGRYGLRTRTCRCGSELPTLAMFGRNRLDAFCPRDVCRRPLSGVIGSARNVHIAVVGGTSAGKTAYLTSAVRDLSKLPKVHLRYLEGHAERAMSAAIRGLEVGRTVQKTAPGSPNAFLLQMGKSRRRSPILYLYDAAGELYAGSDALREQNYFSTAHAILLLVDPFSIDRVRADYAHALDPLLDQIRPSEERPQDVYDRVMLLLRERRDGDASSVPLAIVLTKCDSFQLDDELRTAADRLTSVRHPMSEAVRAWLLDNGVGNLVRSAERDFNRVRYFRCSALGRIPDESGAPYRSLNVLEPLAWVGEELRVGSLIPEIS